MNHASKHRKKGISGKPEAVTLSDVSLSGYQWCIITWCHFPYVFLNVIFNFRQWTSEPVWAKLGALTTWDFNDGTLKGDLFRKHIIKEFSRQRENALLTSYQQVAVGKQRFCLHKCPCMAWVEEVKYSICIYSDRPVNYGRKKTSSTELQNKESLLPDSSISIAPQESLPA